MALIDITSGFPQENLIQPGSPGAGTDAFAIFDSILRRYGLTELSGWALTKLTSGTPPATLQFELWEQPAFKARFASIFERESKGLPPISPDEVVAYEAEATDMYHAAGLPVGFYDDPADFQRLIGGNVSLRELSSRVVDGITAASNEPPEVRQAFSDFYGVDTGGLAAYWLDPERSNTLLQRQFTAAQAAGHARRTGFGDLAREDAEMLADWGITGAQAAQGFGLLSGAGELFTALPGSGESDFTRRQVLAAGFQQGSNEMRELQRRADQRVATFQGGGSFSSGREGFSGLGSTTR